MTRIRIPCPTCTQTTNCFNWFWMMWMNCIALEEYIQIAKWSISCVPCEKFETLKECNNFIFIFYKPLKPRKKKTKKPTWQWPPSVEEKYQPKKTIFIPNKKRRKNVCFWLEEKTLEWAGGYCGDFLPTKSLLKILNEKFHK